MATKAELLAQAEELGVDVKKSASKAEIEAALAPNASEPELDAADATIPGDEENAPDSLKELAALDAPEVPLAATPTVTDTAYDAVGHLGAKHEDVKVDVPDDGGVPPEVARGPLPGTPPDGWREDYYGERQVVGPSQPVNTDPHQQGGADTEPDRENASRQKLQEKANAPGQPEGKVGKDTGRVEDGDGGGAAAPERADDAASKPVQVKDGV